MMRGTGMPSSVLGGRAAALVMVMVIDLWSGADPTARLPTGTVTVRRSCGASGAVMVKSGVEVRVEAGDGRDGSGAGDAEGVVLLVATPINSSPSPSDPPLGRGASRLGRRPRRSRWRRPSASYDSCFRC